MRTHLDLGEATAILERTPAVLQGLLSGLSEAWIRATEGGDSWSPFDVVGHLIHGEKTDWMPRARIILEHGEARAFEPFDRFAQLAADKDRTLGELLDEFAALRRENLRSLRALDLSPADLTKRGVHPELGPVTLGELLATWVVHDLGHLAQIARVMAGRYSDRVGAWSVHLPILDPRPA